MRKVDSARLASAISGVLESRRGQEARRIRSTENGVPHMHDGFVSPTVQDNDLTERQALNIRTCALLAAASDCCANQRKALLDEVVTSHLWLAETLARRFQHRGEDDDDLLQVARVGLVEAAQRFDPAQSSFVAFAVPTINGVLKRHFRDTGWVVRPPRQTQELAAAIWRHWPELTQRLGAVPTHHDLARILDAPVAQIQQASSASRGYHATSIEAALDHGAAFVSAEAEQEIDRTEARIVLAEVLDQLTDSERELLRQRFGEQRSQTEIAAQFGTSQMQISRLLARLLEKMRLLVGDADGMEPESCASAHVCEPPSITPTTRASYGRSAPRALAPPAAAVQEGSIAVRDRVTTSVKASESG